MAKQGLKKKVRESGLKKVSASSASVAAAAEFLHHVERSRKNYKPDLTPLNPLREKLVAQIEIAFAGVQCLNEPYVLLCGEAMDDYLSLQSVDEETGEFYGRNQFLPWELDEYRTRYADKLTHREYGDLLMQRYAESVELKN